MKVILQRVNRAAVMVEGETIGSIERGLLLLVGLGTGDDEGKLKPMAEKIVNMRIFPNDEGKFHFSVLDVGGAVLAVPQFTLFADTSKGRRPEFFGAMHPGEAEPMFGKFVEVVRGLGVRVETGRFGAHMHVALENDGPVTISLES